MKTISNDFKTTLTKFGREYKNKIIIYDYDVWATESNDFLTSENGDDLIAKVSNTDVDIQLNDENLFSVKIITKGEVLSTLMKELDFESNQNLEIGRVLNYQFGLKIDEDEYEYIDYGKYIIYNKEYDESSQIYTYTCYDYMLRTMRTVGREFVYSQNKITGTELLEKICDILSLNFDNSLTDESNKPTPYGMIGHKTQEININLLLENKLTYRDILNLLCKYFGVSMYMEDNNLIIKLLGDIIYDDITQEWYVENENPTPVATINEDYLKDSNIIFKDTYGPINSVELIGIDESKQQYVADLDSISVNGETMYSVKNNILLNDRNTWDLYGYTIANDIFKLIKGTSYELNDMSTNGVLYLDWLDWYNVNIGGVNHKCLLLNNEITIRSGIQETIYTEIPEETETEYTTTANSYDDIIADTLRAKGNCYATNFEATGRVNAQSIGPDLETAIRRLIQSSSGTHESIPIGTIQTYAGSTAPTGYLICDGSAISRTDYSKLFDVIGTNYGIGDGSTTFNLPDLKGKIPVGLDNNDTDFDTLGETGGEKTHTLIIDEMPNHNHEVATAGGTGMGAGYSYTSQGGWNSNFVKGTGGGQPHNNLQPYIVLNYIIKAN